jgi:hypothetical protein
VSVAEPLVVPRIMFAPDYVSSAGAEAIELAALAGLELDPWERLVLEVSLGEAADGRWAATEVGLCVPRQNGKNVVLEARELAGLFLLGEELIIHSAHHFKTAKEHFLRLLSDIEETPELEQRVQRVIRAHGEEGIELRGGQRILFATRTKSAGRGFTAPLVIFDESMYLAETSIGALVPTTSAIPNRQRWYTGSAVDEQVHPDGVVFARVRERALRGEDPRLAYFEWSHDAERPEQLEDHELADPEVWARANPGYGIRISEEAIEDELRSMDRRTFAVERLGVGAWPDTSPGTGHVVPIEVWNDLVDEASGLVDPVCFAYDVAPDRSSAAIAAAGRRGDGLWHGEIVHHRRGTGWIVPTLLALSERWNPVAIMADGAGPAGALINRCENVGLTVEAVAGGDYARACGQFVDFVGDAQLRHLGSAELLSALKGATTRPLGDSWAWSRKNSGVDISPLCAITLALWGAVTLGWDANEDPVIY